MSNKIIADTLLNIADAIESGSFGNKPKIGITNVGSEHGLENIVKAVDLAKSDLFDVVMIGEAVEGYEVVEAANEDEMYQKMEAMLDSGELAACVTMHYPFPIGVSTVGRMTVPANGKEVFIATTTGTTSTNRLEAMVKNAINGIIAAKSTGIEEPTIGVINIDGAHQVEKALTELKDNGYPIHFGESARADGGITLRGNDILMGSTDVLVTDSLTGNILMKLLSSFNTGGTYEAVGYGYGPGIGEGFKRNVFIVSRASGAPVLANALKYAYDTVKGKNLRDVSHDEYHAAKKAGLDEILEELVAKSTPKAAAEEVVEMPEKTVVDASIEGIDILEIDDAAKALWKEGIYAESGMGCTGPMVQVSSENISKARTILREGGYISE